MKIIHSASLTEADFLSFDPDTRLWVYNGLDCMVTHEVFDVLQNNMDRQNSGNARRVYNFERAMQLPSLLMSRRGVRVDLAWRDKLLGDLGTRLDRLTAIFQDCTEAICSARFNPNSPTQLAKLFHGALRLPATYKRRKHSDEPRKITLDRKALEKLKGYAHAAPLVAIIDALRTYKRLSSVLMYGLEGDRFHATFSVAGTENGRWSSYNNCFGTGGNLQNITPYLRRMFVPDPGFTFVYLDGEQAEARFVAYRSGDQEYIRAVESADLHTNVTQRIWPSLPWTGDPKRDRAIADTPAQRIFTYRDLAKRVAHGTNYDGSAPGVAQAVGIPIPFVVEAQRSYFAAFPGIRTWQGRVKHEVMSSGKTVSILGRERQYFGRLNDEHTHKEAIAGEPQSVIADLTNRGVYDVCLAYSPKEVQALVQVHDGVLFQVRTDLVHEITPKLIASFLKPVAFPSGIMYIPVEAKVGMNWNSASAENPEGLRKYVPKDP